LVDGNLFEAFDELRGALQIPHGDRRTFLQVAYDTRDRPGLATLNQIGQRAGFVHQGGHRRHADADGRVDFVRYARNQFAEGGHLVGFDQPLLCPDQILIGMLKLGGALCQFLAQADAADGAAD